MNSSVQGDVGLFGLHLHQICFRSDLGARRRSYHLHVIPMRFNRPICPELGDFCLGWNHISPFSWTWFIPIDMKTPCIQSNAVNLATLCPIDLGSPKTIVVQLKIYLKHSFFGNLE
jgi:hypothetical protein